MATTQTKVERGQFFWYELLTNDVKAAIDFYSDVIGWTTQEYDAQGFEGPSYTLWMAGDAPVGGVMQIDRETMGDAAPDWLGYVQTPDVDATAEQVKQLGGRVIAEPMDLPTVGRMAGIADPQGATLWIMAPGSGEPMPEPTGQGSFSWTELLTTDYNAAFDFYSRLFGWKQWDDMDMGGGMMYRMFGQGDTMYGGMYDRPADIPASSHWLYYVKVDDIDAALGRVKERGGQVVTDPMEVPGGDRVAECKDPEGVSFALNESKK